jgi:hypothetical protein
MLGLCQVLEKVADVIFGIPEFSPALQGDNRWLLHETHFCCDVHIGLVLRLQILNKGLATILR